MCRESRNACNNIQFNRALPARKPAEIQNNFKNGKKSVRFLVYHIHNKVRKFPENRAERDLYSLVCRLPLFFNPVGRDLAIPGIDLDADPLPVIA